MLKLKVIGTVMGIGLVTYFFIHAIIYGLIVEKELFRPDLFTIKEQVAHGLIAILGILIGARVIRDDFRFINRIEKDNKTFKALKKVKKEIL